MRMVTVTALHNHPPSSMVDMECRALFDKVPDSKFIGSGVLMVGPQAGTRDIEYQIPDHAYAGLVDKLQEAGYRWTSME